MVFPIACFSLVSFASDASLNTRFLSCTCCTFVSSSIFFFLLRGFAPSLGCVFGSVLSHLFVPFLSVFFVVFFRRRRTARSLLYHPFFLSTSFVSLDRWHLRRWAWHASWYAHTPHRHTPWTTTPRTVGVERSQGGNHPPPLPSLSPSHRDQGRLGVVRMGVVRDPRSLLHAPMEEPLLPRKEGGMGSNRNQEGRGK